jgi:hypothetical protein
MNDLTKLFVDAVTSHLPRFATTALFIMRSVLRKLTRPSLRAHLPLPELTCAASKKEYDQGTVYALFNTHGFVYLL